MLIPVDGIGVMFIEIVDSLVQFGAALRLVDGQIVEVRVGVQCKLVHWINGAHVIEHEEENSSALGTRTITLGVFTIHTSVQKHHINTYSRGS